MTEPLSGPFTALSVGEHHTCALEEDGDIDNHDDDNEDEVTPVQVACPPSVQELYRSLAVCWPFVGRLLVVVVNLSDAVCWSGAV